MGPQYWRALRFVRPYAWRLAGVTLIGMLATALSLAQPYFSKLLIDDALLSRNPRALASIAAAMAVVTIAGFALNILSSYRYVGISAQMLFDIRLTLYQHLQLCSPRFWARSRLGDVVSRINNDVAEVQRIAADTLLAACANAVFLIGAAAIMIWFSPAVFLLSVAALPVSVWALRRYQGRLAAHARHVRERSADIGSFLIETLTGFRLVATSNAEAYEAERFRQYNRRFVDALLNLQWTSYLAGAVPGAVLTLSTVAVFLYGGRLAIDGALTPGALVALMAYHVRLLGPIQNLLGLYNGLVTGGASLQRLFELLDTPVEVRDEPAEPLPSRSASEIRIENVSFRHDHRPVLDGVSAIIEPGALCVIAGPSGAGKSTLADLLVRFYDPSAGRILLDGRDLRAMSLRQLRNRVVLVDQSAFIFHASARENIRYGSPDAIDAEIEAAARAALIHDRIAAMPQGYDTVVGERGLTLSAGERHRITLARALLRNPAVLILDEPTAALDEATEREIMTTLATAMRGRTSILITHRPALAALADQTIVLDRGRARVERSAMA